MNVSIILPTYNERDNIGDLIDAIEAVLRAFRLGRSKSWWSTTTARTARPSWCRGAPPGRGSPSAASSVWTSAAWRRRLNYGIKHSTGDIIVVMDTDFNHDPAMIPQMVKFLEYYDMVIGSRFRDGRRDGGPAALLLQPVLQPVRAAGPAPAGAGQPERLFCHPPGALEAAQAGERLPRDTANTSSAFCLRPGARATACSKYPYSMSCAAMGRASRASWPCCAITPAACSRPGTRV